MASSTISSELRISLVEDATKQAPKVADAIERMQKETQALQKALAASGTSDRLQKSLLKLAASETHVEALARAMRDYAKAEGLASDASHWTEAQTSRYRAMEDAGVKAIRAQIREEARLAHARHEQSLQEVSDDTRQRAAHAKVGAHSDNTVAGVASLYAAHSAVHAAERVVERYREYDKERRYEKVVMGLSDEQQRPLVDQAIHGSGDSRYNDVQWLAAQRNLAARGYNREQVLGFTPVTAQLGQAFDLEKMEDGVKLLEGAMLGFKKDVSTKEAAKASAQRTADLEVKSSKISGMNAEDIEQLYKRGAAAARMAGLTEEQMLAFGGAAKKVNIGGDESATAFVSLTKNLLHPTHEALTAMRASGIDFSKYQKIGPVNEDGFAAEVASNFGVKLKSGVRAGLHKIFADPEMMKDPAKFTPAITRLLRRDLSGNDAESLRSIAGLAGRYREASASGVDTQGLLTAIMEGLAKNPALAIALFGPKQAGRISAGLDKDTFAHLLDELKNHSEGFAEKVSTERMSGFDGAMAKLTNQVAILETALGRAFDNNGEGRGGMLTRATEGVGKTIEILSDLNPHLLRVGAEAVALAAGFAALKGVGFLKGGFGLNTAATRLDHSAVLLDEAAMKLGATGGAAKASQAAVVAEGAGTAAPKTGVMGSAGLKGLAEGASKGIIGYFAYEIGKGAIETVTDALPHPEYRDGYDPAKIRDRSVFGNAEAFWAHLHGRNTPEEIAARQAAETPIAPPKVPAEAPYGDAADDAANDAAEDKKSPAPAEKAVSPFLARHPDFKRQDDAAEDAAPIAGKRASGGPVSRGKTYLVGEHGPELFTAGMNGAISTTDVQRLLSQDRASSVMIARPRAIATGAIVAAINDMHRDMVSGFVAVARQVGQPDARHALPGEHPPIAGKRASGGPVSRGKTYLVGEHGPELFTAGMNGAISTTQVQRLLSQDRASSVMIARPQAIATGAIVAAINDMHRDMVSVSVAVARQVGQPDVRHGLPGEHPPIAGKRASGGPVSRGKTYLVGEHGPELFTAGMNGAISTADVQRLLSKASYHPAEGGDGETAKAVRALGFALAGAVDGVARAVDRLDAQRTAAGGDVQGNNPFYGAEGADGHPRSFGGGGRRGFMEGGHGSEGAGRQGGRKGFAHRAAEGPGADVPTDGDSVKVATSMLKKREGFQATAKWDKNHLRLGYGSDTITDAQGGVHEVKAGDHVTREDAERDLARRIPEFQRRIAREVGPESWKKLSPVVQGALTSMAYNYGGFSKLPTMRAAIASGDNAKIAAAIRLREGDNAGINRERREEEARVIEHGGARPASLADAGGRVDKVTGGIGDRLASFKRAGVLSNEQCVELARRMVGDTGHVNTWRPGEKADAGHLKPGTPVATFLDAHGREVDRYADGTGGRPKRGLDHAAVFEGYERDQAGKITGMKVAEQYKGSGGVHDKVYPFHSGQFGEHDGSNYHAVMRADGAYLGGRNNPMAEATDDPLALRRSRDAKGSDKVGGEGVHDGLSALHGKAFAPAVDNSHLHETEASLDRIHEKMGKIHEASAKHRSHGGGTAIAGLSSRLRGGFMHSGSQIG